MLIFWTVNFNNFHLGRVASWLQWLRFWFFSLSYVQIAFRFSISSPDFFWCESVFFKIFLSKQFDIKLLWGFCVMVLLWCLKVQCLVFCQSVPRVVWSLLLCLEWVFCFVLCFLNSCFVLHLMSLDLFPKLLIFFIVCNRRSTIPIPLWSPAGADISLLFSFLQIISNSFALNASAWSHLIDPSIPWSLHYHSRYSIAVLV